ncbi:unnamed protein product [Mytilus coruscus]|uniref:Uncharacterized protein n=1 Tax=Mytilus coruscus TaxID=42192 RepID=A0A6J8CHH6_MYTCO|nr:unnamed protein product [Mytilus coruscus]
MTPSDLSGLTIAVKHDYRRFVRTDYSFKKRLQVICQERLRQSNMSTTYVSGRLQQSKMTTSNLTNFSCKKTQAICQERLQLSNMSPCDLSEPTTAFKHDFQRRIRTDYSYQTRLQTTNQNRLQLSNTTLSDESEPTTAIKHDFKRRIRTDYSRYTQFQVNVEQLQQ